MEIRDHEVISREINELGNALVDVFPSLFYSAEDPSEGVPELDACVFADLIQEAVWGTDQGPTEFRLPLLLAGLRIMERLTMEYGFTYESGFSRSVDRTRS